MQFEGRKTYGRVAQGGTGPTRVRQVHVLEETAHAKSVGDGLASEIKNKVASNVKGGYSALPGTRNHVLLLAQLHPRPKGDEANKFGMWASKRIIYAYYSEEVLRTGSSQDFKTFPKSKSHRFRYGYNEVDGDPAKRGLLRIRQGFCACSSCHAPKFDFGACQFNALLGRTGYAECPPLGSVAGATTRTTEIPQFAATLKVGEVRAADISREDAEVEGAPFWLCFIKEPARQLLAPTVFAGVSFDEGWWVVPVQWLEFNGSESGHAKLRRYKLGQVQLISVHSLVRCDAVKLSEPAAVATAAAVAAADGAPVGRGRPKTVFVLPSDECARIAQHTEIQEL